MKYRVEPFDCDTWSVIDPNGNVCSQRDDEEDAKTEAFVLNRAYEMGESAALSARDAALERVKELEKALESAPLGRVDDDFNRGQNFVLRLYAPLLGCEHMPTHSNFKRSLETALERVRVLSNEVCAYRHPDSKHADKTGHILTLRYSGDTLDELMNARSATDAANALDGGAA